MFSTSTFDWPGAIERNSEALRGVIDILFAMLASLGQASVQRVSPAFHRAVLRLLQPAESAMRRLVVIAARGLVVKPGPSRPMPARSIGKGRGSSPGFRLFDPRKRLVLYDERAVPPSKLPRIHVFGADPRVAALWAARRPTTPAPSRDGLFNGEKLVRRLRALKSALDNLPRQARRLARWRLRQKKYKSPLRPGPPPGHRRKKTHEIDDILTECHALAWGALKPDTS